MTSEIELEAHEVPPASSKIHAFYAIPAILDDTNVRPLKVTVPALLDPIRITHKPRKSLQKALFIT